GSGFIWDRKGHVVTNYHVIADGNIFEVTLQDGKTYEAKLVGGDPNKDIAVLKLQKPPANLTPIRLPSPEYTLEVGQKALAIGNPFGLDHTLTVGVVSALGREMLGYGGTTIRGMIQTDASINPGNSGGPLLNARGQLIGVNTMIYSKTGSSAGIGFAVPVQTVRRVVPEVIRYGKPVRAGLGIQLVPDSVARRHGIRGVVIEAVSPGSPAAQAGLRGLQRKRRSTVVGDVIVGINETAVATYDDLYGALDRFRPGDSVKVKVQRDNKVITVPLTLKRLN
ncbi:MAG: trypsin-like peptidase domain-containing protein, partial [Myxococcota bacterium]